MDKRKSYSNEFKARVALEAIKGDKTINEIASEYKLHANMITKWKKHLLDNVAGVFAVGGREKSEDAEKEELYKQIGKQKVELDWLKKKVGYGC
jgi:transposase-like protein